MLKGFKISLGVSLLKLSSELVNKTNNISLTMLSRELPSVPKPALSFLLITHIIYGEWPSDDFGSLKRSSLLLKIGDLK